MSVELLIPYPFTSAYNVHTPNYWTRYNAKGEAYFNSNSQSILILFIRDIKAQ